MAGGSWRPMSTTGAPSARQDALSAWTGKELLVIGGRCMGAMGTSYEDPKDGFAYDPAADAWRPLSMDGGPASTENLCCAWTGAALLVMGGGPLVRGAMDAWSYDPAQDRWTALPAEGRPSWRQNAALVWTGQEALLLGGYGMGLKGFGHAYDPAANTWRKLLVKGSPTHRYWHRVAWTGSEVLGVGGSTPTGGKQGPPFGFTASPPRWRALSLAGAPGGERLFHSVVWTGRELLVWGGTQGRACDDGGHYDPATDAWTPIGAKGVPEARGWHVSAWTSDRLLVWGGANFARSLGDGALYDPAARTWTPMASEGAPSPRRSCSAAWTGRELLVWGGSKSVTMYGDGARWSPG